MGICKLGFKQMGSLIVAAVISVFLVISMNVIFSAIFTEEIGYTAYVYENKESTEAFTEYQYRYSDTDGDGKDDGVDEKRKEYEANGNVVVVQMERSSLAGKGYATFLTVTQLFCLVMVFAFAGDRVYKQGLKDAVLIRNGSIKKDTLKGLKVGFIGNIPFFLLAILMVVFACGVLPRFKIVWYAFINGYFYPLIMSISGARPMPGADYIVSNISIIRFVFLFAIQLLIPIISCVAYILGLKEINLGEKIVLKKR